MKIFARMGLALILSVCTLGSAANAGFTPQYDLLKAVDSNDIPKLTELLNKGISPDTRQRSSGQPAIMIAARKGNNAVLKLLLDHKANPDMADRGNGETALMVRAIAGDTEGVKMLISAGADVDRMDSSLETPLIKAVRNRQFSTAQVLVDAGADPNKQDLTGKSALDYAKERRNGRMIRLLEGAGSDGN